MGADTSCASGGGGTDAAPRVGERGRVDTWIGDMHLFVAVAKARSFTRAAHQLGMPHSTLSRRIAALEKALGVRLLTRTTRHVELTEDGLDYLARAERVVADALAIHEDISLQRGKPSGLLRISIPECIALQVATPWIAEFSRLYPDITVQIDTAPEHADMVRDAFDLCISHVAVKEPSTVRRTIASFRRVLFASPAYIARYGQPQVPEDLARHQCICMTENRSGGALWTLARAGETRMVAVSGPVATLSQVLAPELAKEGLGIASGMPGPLQGDVDAGQLVPVLPEWEADPLIVSIAMPDRLVAARTRAFIDFFIERYRSVAELYA